MPRYEVTVRREFTYYGVEAASEQEALDAVAFLNPDAEDDVDSEAFEVGEDDEEAEAAEMFAPAIQATAEAIEEYRKESEADAEDARTAIEAVKARQQMRVVE